MTALLGMLVPLLNAGAVGGVVPGPWDTFIFNDNEVTVEFSIPQTFNLTQLPQDF